MPAARRFEDLRVWQQARVLVRDLYRVTSRSEFSNDRSLRDQIRRAGVSVLSNIAEGFEREGSKEFGQFLSTAKGSCGEIRAQLWLAQDLGYIDLKEFDLHKAQAEGVSRQIWSLMKYLRNSGMRGSKYHRDAEPDDPAASTRRY